MSYRLLLALSFVASTELSAQLQPGHPDYKDPGTAILLELLVPGGGHLYAGETRKGKVLLASSLGAATAGFVATLATSDFCTGKMSSHSMMACPDGPRLNWTPFVVGAVVGLGIHAYGLLDAGPAARRANARGDRAAGDGRVRPLVAAGLGGATRLGLEIPIGQ